MRIWFEEGRTSSHRKSENTELKTKINIHQWMESIGYARLRKWWSARRRRRRGIADRRHFNENALSVAQMVNVRWFFFIWIFFCSCVRCEIVHSFRILHGRDRSYPKDGWKNKNAYRMVLCALFIAVYDGSDRGNKHLHGLISLRSQSRSLHLPAATNYLYGVVGCMWDLVCFVSFSLSSFASDGCYAIICYCALHWVAGEWLGPDWSIKCSCLCVGRKH